MEITILFINNIGMRCDARLFFLGGIFPYAGDAVSSVLLGDSTLEKVPLESPAL
jgi:hypothetical protein